MKGKVQFSIDQFESDQDRRALRLVLPLTLVWLALIFLFAALGHSTIAGVIGLAGFFLGIYITNCYFVLLYETYSTFGDIGHENVGCVVIGTVFMILLTTLFGGLAQDRYSAYRRVYDPCLAVKAGDRKTLQTLLEGFDADTPGYNLNTPLHAAARRGQTETIDWLLQRGADVNARNQNGQTPLAVAVQWNREEAVRLLRKHGAIRLEAPANAP